MSATSANSGYSGTPLAKKLGYIGAVWAIGMPLSVRAEIETVGDVSWQETVVGAVAAHFFVTERKQLEQLISQARTKLGDDAMVWISWPKKASKVETDITEDVVRDVALPIGFVDIKVCAVDAIWSGIKLMVRKELRNPNKQIA